MGYNLRNRKIESGSDDAGIESENAVTGMIYPF